MNPSRIVGHAVLVLMILTIAFPVIAIESRVVDGDGINFENFPESAEICTIGVCAMVADSSTEERVIDWGYEDWLEEFIDTGSFNVVELADINPMEMTEDEIISLGESFGIDAFVVGDITRAKQEFQFLMGVNVSIEIAFDMYSGENGKLIWERTLKKQRNGSTYSFDLLGKRFSEDIVMDMVLTLAEDGISGCELNGQSIVYTTFEDEEEEE